MAKKRTQQTERMVERVNQILRANHIQDESNEMFWITATALMYADVYKGYRYFYDRECEDKNISGMTFSIPTGITEEEVKKYNGYIQLV